MYLPACRRSLPIQRLAPTPGSNRLCYRECHIQGDWLLIYRLEGDTHENPRCLIAVMRRAASRRWRILARYTSWILTCRERPFNCSKSTDPCSLDPHLRGDERSERSITMPDKEISGTQFGPLLTDRGVTFRVWAPASHSRRRRTTHGKNARKQSAARHRKAS